MSLHLHKKVQTYILYYNDFLLMIFPFIFCLPRSCMNRYIKQRLEQDWVTIWVSSIAKKKKNNNNEPTSHVHVHLSDMIKSVNRILYNNVVYGTKC